MCDLAIPEVVREYFPGAGDDFIEHVVWDLTGFPNCWRIPRDGATPSECFRMQLARVADCMDRCAPVPDGMGGVWW